MRYRVVVPIVAQSTDDGSLKSGQTFYPVLDAAVEFADTHGGPTARITETIHVPVSPEAIAAARARIEAKRAAGK